MRIVIISEWFSEGMGYLENTLPKALARLGHEVHVIAGNIQVYFDQPFYGSVYESYLGPATTECGTKELDGYTLHRLPHSYIRPFVWIHGLSRETRNLRPDIVQTFDVMSFSTYRLAHLRAKMGFGLFTGFHGLASVFPPLSRPRHGLARIIQMAPWKAFELMGGYVSRRSVRCYSATDEGAEIALKFFRTEKEKISVLPLCVDTEVFCPAESIGQRVCVRERRKELGFSEQDIVCIYTGRFEEGKNPLCLAEAIEELRRAGEPYRAVFIGSGTQERAIASHLGSVVRPFMKFGDLAPYYRLADIGVWPRQESTSVLDATACGKPVVVSDKVLAKDRIEGNGITYRENDPVDLVRALLELKDRNRRDSMGSMGVEKIRAGYDMQTHALKRVYDYNSFLAACAAGR